MDVEKSQIVVKAEDYSYLLFFHNIIKATIATEALDKVKESYHQTTGRGVPDKYS